MSALRKCTVLGCDKRHLAQGLCNAHYKRLKKYGEPLAGGVEHGAAWRYLQDVVLNFSGRECLTWPFTRAGNGYPYVRYNGKTVGAHRVVCELIYGPAPTEKHEAAHLCGKGHEGCVNPAHLQWKTGSENSADKVLHGTHSRGSRNRMAVLTEDRVKQIRALRGKLPGRDLARQFGASTATISEIQNSHSWTWL